MMAPTKEFELVMKKEPNGLLKRGNSIQSVNEIKSNNGDADDKSSNLKTQGSESFIEKFAAFRITVSSLQFKS